MAKGRTTLKARAAAVSIAVELLHGGCDGGVLDSGSGAPSAVESALRRFIVHGTDLIFDIGVEPKSKGLKHRDACGNKTQVTFVHYLQQGSVSMGVCLSLDINRAESSGDSA
ncbi:hypothetical protein MLD38_002062 [Melastoma candidum]|uniref:Uncharacterized protein n=1 Tax=Melastoma candidum TaxID=119954 RepID=A0ACB9SF59_9MYRT|nr:hypothetical protein MLD38_002062 [Melastoma candidum]